jgi:ribose/xylose/arabinose/galactoside ABC-type transport system permease subunit
VSGLKAGANLEPPKPAASFPRPAAFLSLLGPYLGLALVILLFSLLLYRQRGLQGLESFLSLNNLKLVVVHASIPAAVALGMTVIMISGGIDLSVGYVVSLVTVTAMMTYRWAVKRELAVELASIFALVVGLGTALACGFLNGQLITRLKVVPFVVTLGMMGVARGLAQYLTGGTTLAFPDPTHPPAWVPWLAALEPTPTWLGIGPAAWSVGLCALAVAILLRYTVLGRYCFALGSNEATARLCGIRVERTKVIIYTIGGLLTGWGGILQFARDSAGFHAAAAGLELDVIAAVVIGGGSLSGGEGTVSGTLVGALMITVLGNGCSKLGLPMEFRFIVIGLIIVVVSALNMWRIRRQSMGD